MPANAAPAADICRRPGVLAVHSVDHVAFAVPDLNEAQKFYEAFGLDVKPTPAGLEIHAAGRPQHCWMKISAGPTKRLSYLSFGIFPDDLPRFREKLTRAGLLTAPPPGVPYTNSLSMSESLWLRDPHGIAVELRVANKCTPDDKTISESRSTPAGVVASYSRSKAGRVRPERLSHVALFTHDVPGAVAFYREILGIRLSDSSLDIVAFMHGAHGSDHHMIAFVKSGGAGLHHVSWAVGSLDEVGLGAAQMAAAGYPRGWGTGRHILGSNYFFYVRDPWG